MTLTPQQRIDALLAALPMGPVLDRFIPAPVTLPKMPERLIAN